MINNNDNVEVTPSKWKGGEAVSAAKLNESVNAINKILVGDAAPPGEEVISILKQSPVVYQCVTKGVSGTDSEDPEVTGVGAVRVFLDGSRGAKERFLPKLYSQAIGVGEFLVPVRQMNGLRVWVSTGIGVIDNPSDFTYTGEHQETAITDDTGWDRHDPPSNGESGAGEIGVTLGLTITQSTGIAYYHTGDKKIYSYVRDFTYDSSGKLVSVSAETRVEVEAPTDCTV